MFRVPLPAGGAGGTTAGGTPPPLPAEQLPLTSEPTVGALVDREGNVWVGTSAGIERFRETRLTAVPLPRPLLGASVMAADDGSVWVGRFYDPPLAVRGGAVTAARGPPDVACAYRDLDGGLWFGTAEGVWHAPAGASPSSALFTRIPLPAETGRGDVQAIARTPGGELWASIRGGRTKGVFRRRGAAWSPAPLPPGFSNQIAMTAAADSGGRVWLGYTAGRLVRFAAGTPRVYTARDGLHVGTVTALLVRGPRVWIGGEFGLTQLAGERFRPLRARERLRGITGIVETAGGDLWLHGVDGVTHIPAAEVARALGDSAYRARVERFDHLDGLPGQAPQVRPLPSAIQGTDGRLWFTTETGVTWIDPANIRRNPLPPPVQVRAVSAAGTRYDAGRRVRLPARTTQLQVAYTAMSLAIPDRVRFRYRLSGVDTAWVDAGTRREAFYTNLGPGTRRFQVIAANEDGVWNEAGASIDLEIPPTFTQTRAFLVLVALAVAAAAWMLALWRQRQLARALRAQFEGQLAERARVARELHDTLLGDMAGLAMQLSAGARQVEASGAPVAELLARLGAQVQRTLVEARRSVTAMRADPGALAPLHERLAEAAARAFAGSGIAARVEHTGTPRPLAPAAENEVLGIVAEAMANARKHAEPRTVTVACDYAPRVLRVAVRDDGRGFDPSRAAPEGHWGLVGMRERAAAIGARLAVESAPGEGTTVRLEVPAP